MTEAIKQRRALEEQRTRAWDDYGSSTKQRQAAELELAHAKRGLDQMTKLRPAGQATDKQVTTAERRLEEAQAAYECWHNRTNAALSAAKALDADLDDLLRKHPDQYAEEAERVTQAAVQQLEALSGALRDAQTAWQAAEAAWRPLTRALRLEPVAPWPLPQPQDVLDVVPRPRAVVLTE